MPSAPKISNTGGSIRIIEVFQEMEAEHFPHTDGHIAVAAEIIINLQPIGQGRKPRFRHGQPGVHLRKKGICRHRHGIGNQHLFRKPDNKPAKAVRHLLRRRGTLSQLCGNVAVAHDGSGNQLREKGDIQQQIKKVILNQFFVPVRINGVRHDLEREKRYTNRQCNLRHRNCKPQNGIDTLDKKAHILKSEQCDNVQY